VDANRTLALVRRVLNYALDAEWVEANVAAKLKRPGGVEASRARVLNHDELRAAWQHLHAPSKALGLKGRRSTLARAALALAVLVRNTRWGVCFCSTPPESSTSRRRCRAIAC
jgi:hypothetical protein